MLVFSVRGTLWTMFDNQADFIPTAPQGLP